MYTSVDIYSTLALPLDKEERLIFSRNENSCFCLYCIL